jgi:hypothetical protein
MTTRKKTAAAASYEPDRLYDVQLTGPAEYPPGSGRMLSPATRIQMKGKVANAVAGKVGDAKPV